MRTHIADFEDAFDEHGRLKDGITHIRGVPMCDSMSKDIAQHFADLSDTCPPIRDSDGRPLWEPGFTQAATKAARDSAWIARRAAYDAYDESIGEQWKTPSGAGSRGFVGAREGDICTINGEAGRLHPDERGRLVCIPDRQSRHGDASTHDKREAAYAAYDAALVDQWRRAR